MCGCWSQFEAGTSRLSAPRCSMISVDNRSFNTFVLSKDRACSCYSLVVSVNLQTLFGRRAAPCLGHLVSTAFGKPLPSGICLLAIGPAMWVPMTYFTLECLIRSSTTFGRTLVRSVQSLRRTLCAVKRRCAGKPGRLRSASWPRLIDVRLDKDATSRDGGASPLDRRRYRSGHSSTH